MPAALPRWFCRERSGCTPGRQNRYVYRIFDASRLSTVEKRSRNGSSVQLCVSQADSWYRRRDRVCLLDSGASPLIVLESARVSGAAGEGVAVDADGNVFAAEGPNSFVQAGGAFTKYSVK